MDWDDGDIDETDDREWAVVFAENPLGWAEVALLHRRKWLQESMEEWREGNREGAEGLRRMVNEDLPNYLTREVVDQLVFEMEMRL